VIFIFYCCLKLKCLNSIIYAPTHDYKSQRCLCIISSFFSRTQIIVKYIFIFTRVNYIFSELFVQTRNRQIALTGRVRALYLCLCIHVTEFYTCNCHIIILYNDWPYFIIIVEPRGLRFLFYLFVCIYYFYLFITILQHSYTYGMFSHTNITNSYVAVSLTIYKICILSYIQVTYKYTTYTIVRYTQFTRLTHHC